ncbi:efflux RND transporter periplasmic adaptor subunit [Vibrio sp.]|nr:efflux RND transporter periplasmic adaptor subunit [Vibrio sp.]
MKIKITSSLLIASTVIASMTAVAQKGPSRSTPVVAESVEEHIISQSLTLIGNLKAEDAIVLRTEVQGRIKSIKATPNEIVKQGQLLVQLDDSKERAQVTEASAYLKDEERKLDEFTRLAKRKAITQTEIEAQKTNVSIAKARLLAAQSDLSDRNIKAPFSGTIGLIDISRGAFIQQGEELFTLDDLSKMELDLQVPERYLSLLHNGMTVQATTYAWKGKTFQGTVTGIDSRIDLDTLNVKVRIHFDNQDTLLKPGMLVSTQLSFAPIQAPIIPVQALEYSGTKRFVYVVSDDNKVKRTEVKLGQRVENQVVIDSGLVIGDRIVVQGVVNMRDGAQVKLLSPEGTQKSKDNVRSSKEQLTKEKLNKEQSTKGQGE